MGVDHTTKNPAEGRASTRLISKKKYNKGLFIFDIEHNPGGECGVWPAAWLLSDGLSGEWPLGGEIDVFEGVNDAAGNVMTLHTSPDCKIQQSSSSPPSTSFKGKLETSDCDVNAPNQDKNKGCGILHSSAGLLQSYGKGMNDVGGGVYATLWTSEEIQIFYFPRGSIPRDIETGDNPDPEKWGVPAARFRGCDIESHFKDMQIIFNTTFCGDWAGKAWGKSEECMKKAKTCEEWVKGNPEVFRDAYWLVRGVQVYQDK